MSNFASLHFSKVPAFLNVTDIAGLVKGASEGQGLGNAFLSHIKACDAIFHLCRKSISPIPPRLCSFHTKVPSQSHGMKCGPLAQNCFFAGTMVTHTHISSHYRFVPDVWHFWMCPASLKDAAPFFSALGPKNKFLLANSVGQILTDTLSIHTMTLWFMIMGQECIFDKQRNPGQERRTILTILATYSAWLCILFKRGKESERKRVKFNRTASRPPSIHPVQARRAVCRSAELRLFSRLSGATF